MSLSMQSHFSSIKDKRQAGKIEHSLIDIIILCICGVVAGADGWSDIEEFMVCTQPTDEKGKN